MARIALFLVGVLFLQASFSSAQVADKDAAKKNQSAVTMATQFSKDKPLVVAGI